MPSRRSWRKERPRRRRGCGDEALDVVLEILGDRNQAPRAFQRGTYVLTYRAFHHDASGGCLSRARWHPVLAVFRQGAGECSVPRRAPCEFLTPTAAHGCSAPLWAQVTDVVVTEEFDGAPAVRLLLPWFVCMQGEKTVLHFVLFHTSRRPSPRWMPLET